MKHALRAFVLVAAILMMAAGTAQLIVTDSSLTGNGSTANPLKVVTSVIQKRVTGTCADPDGMTAVNVDGTVTCSTTTLGGTLTTGSLSVATGPHTLSSYAGSSCGAHTAATSESVAGALTCSNFFDTAGTGLTSTGSTVSVGLNGNAAQSCAAGNAVTGLSAAGIETCSANVSAVAAGTGISASTTSGTATVSLNINGGVTQTCTAGQAVTSMTGAGVESCSAFLGSSSVSGVSGRVAVFNGTNSVTGYAGLTSDTSGNVTGNAFTTGTLTLGSNALNNGAGGLYLQYYNPAYGVQVGDGVTSSPFTTRGNVTMGLNSSSTVEALGPTTLDSALHVIGAQTNDSTIDATKAVGTALGTNYNVQLIDSTSQAAGVGGALLFGGAYTGTTPTTAGEIKAMKANSTAGDFGFDLVFGGRQNGGGVVEGLRVIGGVGDKLTGQVDFHYGSDDSYFFYAGTDTYIRGISTTGKVYVGDNSTGGVFLGKPGETVDAKSILQVDGDGVGNIPGYRSTTASSGTTQWGFGEYDDSSYRWYYYNGSAWTQEALIEVGGVFVALGQAMGVGGLYEGGAQDIADSFQATRLHKNLSLYSDVLGDNSIASCVGTGGAWHVCNYTDTITYATAVQVSPRGVSENVGSITASGATGSDYRQYLYLAQHGIGDVRGLTVTVSVYIKVSTGTQNLSVTVARNNFATDAASTTCAVSSAWVRCAVTKTFSATSVTDNSEIDVDVTGFSSAFTTYLADDQVEVAPAATPWVRTQLKQYLDFGGFASTAGLQSGITVWAQQANAASNNYTVKFVNDGTGAGSITGDATKPTIHYQTGVTTNGQACALLNATYFFCTGGSGGLVSSSGVVSGTTYTLSGGEDATGTWQRRVAVGGTMEDPQVGIDLPDPGNSGYRTSLWIKNPTPFGGTPSKVIGTFSFPGWMTDNQSHGGGDYPLAVPGLAMNVHGSIAQDDTYGSVVFGSPTTINNTLSMGAHLINNVTDPVSAQDAATKNYVDTNSGGTGRHIGHQVLTASSGTYTPTSGTKRVQITMVGGGGGGGGAIAQAVTTTLKFGMAGGGASGVYWAKWIDPAATVTGGSYACGAAGAAGTSTPGDGGNGGDTTVVINGTTYTAKGGAGGKQAASGTGLGAGGGFTGGSSAGDQVGGQPGGVGTVSFATATTGSSFASGAGGSSSFGQGGAPVFGSNAALTNSTTGNAGNGKGAGGSGGLAVSSTGAGGGAGTIGVIVIDEFN